MTTHLDSDATPSSPASLFNPELYSEEHVRFLIAHAAEETHHFDDRKHQFVYILAVAALGVFVVFLNDDFHVHAPTIVLGALVVWLSSVLVPACIALQFYTNHYNRFKNNLLGSFYRLASGDVTREDWQASIMALHFKWRNDLQALQKKYRFMFYLIDRLA